MKSTNCRRGDGVGPGRRARTVAAKFTGDRDDRVAQLPLLCERPYVLTSDDLLFEVQATRAGIAAKDRGKARAAFFAKPQASLRSSPRVKTFGWGLHHDAEGRVAAYAIDSDAYCELAARPDLEIVPGMRSKRT